MWRHTVGTKPAADVCLYDEADAAFHLTHLQASRSGELIMLTSGACLPCCLPALVHACLCGGFPHASAACTRPLSHAPPLLSSLSLAAPATYATSEVRFLRADDACGEWTVVRPRQQGVRYIDVCHRGDHLFILVQ